MQRYGFNTLFLPLMSKPISLRIGNILFKHFFPIYNVLYPIFKNRQDADEIRYLKSVIKPGDTILDIGANIGFYSKILSDCVGKDGKVHSFEPDRINFKHLKNNVSAYQNIILVNKAVSDKAGTLNVYKSKDLNVDHRTYPIGDYEAIESIEAVSIDDYLNNGWKVNLIKMDIQGFEVSALKGMKGTIAANPDLLLLLEFWPYGLHEAGSSVAEFCTVLYNLGLKIQFLENGVFMPFNNSYIPEYETWEWAKYKNIVVGR